MCTLCIGRAEVCNSLFNDQVTNDTQCCCCYVSYYDWAEKHMVKGAALQQQVGAVCAGHFKSTGQPSGRKFSEQRLHALLSLIDCSVMNTQRADGCRQACLLDIGLAVVRVWREEPGVGGFWSTQGSTEKGLLHLSAKWSLEGRSGGSDAKKHMIVR